jgi:hypothetical protein
MANDSRVTPPDKVNEIFEKEGKRILRVMKQVLVAYDIEGYDVVEVKLGSEEPMVEFLCCNLQQTPPCKPC